MLLFLFNNTKLCYLKGGYDVYATWIILLILILDHELIYD